MLIGENMETNKIKLSFLSRSENESFARGVISCFALQLNPSVSELADIKTAVSEAVTNAIVHAYSNNLDGEIILESEIDNGIIHINVFDKGVGIENLKDALEPFYTTKPEEERSGMGFTIMKSFMDEVKVESEKGKGTKIYMSKKLKADA
jgi:stage II sporulation protein AB (anti-sigma F factor)